MAEHHVMGYRKYLSFVTNRLLETAVWTFAELDIADLLAAADTPQTADELAQKQGWNSEFLYRLLRLVADADIVREIKSDASIELEKTNRFELTEDGRLLTSNHPSKARYFLCWELSPFAKTISHYLPQLIREGFTKGSGVERFTGGIPFFEFFNKEENREVAHAFNEAMTSYATYSGQPIVNVVDFSRFNTIADIGGNLGALLSHILEKYSTIKQGICFDLPYVISQSKTNNEFERRNISKDRYQYVGGDMFDTKTIPQADAYILQNIIHDWTDNRAIDILKSIRTAANGQKITLFIIGFIIVPDTERNKFINQTVHAYDVHMMMAFNAKERTVEQHEYLFEQSGFKFKHLYRTETPYSIIEAVIN
jgi:hypothetical protein